ncbi:MAG: pyocin knob domain-containing protein, partial [Fusobacteriaceae bacterium]
EYGIVKLSSSLSSREETIGATSRAVSDLYDLVQGASGDYASRVHYHDASDVISGILPVNRGGTGCENLENGFVKFEYGSFMSVSYILVDDIMNIRNEFATLVHQHDWSDILNVPIANDIQAGIVKLSNSSSSDDPRNTAVSLDLFNFLEDQVNDIIQIEPVDAYTKLESDSKFIGYQRELIGEYLDYVTQNGLYSSSESNSNVGEPCSGPYVLEVLNYSFITTQIVTSETGVFIRISKDNTSWCEWVRQWDSLSVKGEATQNEFGFVTKTDYVDLDKPNSVPTNAAIRLYVGEITGDGFEPAFLVLSPEKGGTGTISFEHDKGFVRMDNEIGEMYTVDVVDWSELANIPLSSSSTYGVVKVANTIDHPDDQTLVSASLSLVKEIKDEITSNVNDNFYTKLESDDKFLGIEHELGSINFDTILVAGIYANNNAMVFAGQVNAPIQEGGILTVITGDTSITQLYTSITSKMFVRTFVLGSMNTPWVKVAMGKDVEIATYDDAGIFRVTDLTLDNNSETVPTTRIVNEALSNVINDSTKYVKKSGDIMTGDLSLPSICLGGLSMTEGKYGKMTVSNNINAGDVASIDFSFDTITRETKIAASESVEMKPKKVRRRDVWL